MKIERISLGGVPAVVCGEHSKNIFMFVHGMGGSKEEAVAFAEIVQPKGWQVVGVDLPEHGERKNETEQFFPWVAVPELRAVWDALEKFQPEKIALRANSIGAWFSMLAFSDKQIVQSLFVSPVLDMSRLIEKMMLWANVTIEELQERKIIETGFSQPLSWDYYCYAKQHPVVNWSSPTSLLYGSLENLTDRSDIDAFSERFHCDLTVMENGEHWFHSEEQLKFMNDWIARRV